MSKQYFIEKLMNKKGSRTSLFALVGLGTLIVFIFLLAKGKIDATTFGASLSGVAAFLVTMIGLFAADNKDTKKPAE